MDVKGAKALAERLAQEDDFLSVSEAAILPDTGEVLATRAELVQALREIEERMGPMYEARARIRRALGSRFRPTLPERRSSWTRTQEAVSRCPRCGDRLPKEDEVSTEAREFQALITGAVAGALLKASADGPFLIEVNVPTDEQGNYRNVVEVTGRESGQKLRITVDSME